MFEKDPPSRWKSLINIIVIVIGIPILVILVTLLNIGLGALINIKFK